MPLTLAICYECSAKQNTWDELSNEYFSDPLERWQSLWRREFDDECSLGL